MSVDRGMSVSQARVLASDPKTTPGVMTRLANSYPEVWDDLLANPNIYSELREWISQAKLEQSLVADTLGNVSSEKAQKRNTSKPPRIRKVRKAKSRGRRTYGRIIKSIGLLIVPSLAIYGLWAGLDYLDNNRPVNGVVVLEDLLKPADQPPWTYDLRTEGDPACAIYQFSALEQDMAMVLTQNDLEKKKCKNQENPVKSKLALVNLKTGIATWEVDLAGELDWTQKWSKQLVEIPGLNEILIKFTDVNGRDAAGDSKSIDKSKDRKMKTLVPYNRLNGRITDPVIAKSKYQPIMQAPVLEVVPIPGNLRSILVMTNGSKKDFRYAKYRSKRLSSARWSTESDLKPMGGVPIVNQLLVLGREKGDSPEAISISSGKFVKWNGQPAVKLYAFGKHYVEILGDGTSDKVTNITSQGGMSGHKITFTGIHANGSPKWTLKARGYAISRNDSVLNAGNRLWVDELFALSGKNNRNVSLINTQTGELEWTQKMPVDRFEISRVSSGQNVSVYLTSKTALVAKSMVFLNLADGSRSKPIKIAGEAVRVDGATQMISVLVDEPQRKVAVKNADKGKRTNLNNPASVARAVNTCSSKWSAECLDSQQIARINGRLVVMNKNSATTNKLGAKKTSSSSSANKIRVCARGFENSSNQELWVFECTKNQHITKVAGRWVLVDLNDGGEKFWPLREVN